MEQVVLVSTQEYQEEQVPKGVKQIFSAPAMEKRILPGDRVTLKTHCMTTLSGGVKNLFIWVPGLQKPELHYRFQEKEGFGEMLVALVQTAAPVPTILDTVETIEGDGPSAGTPVHTGFLCGFAKVY